MAKNNEIIIIIIPNRYIFTINYTFCNEALKEDDVRLVKKRENEKKNF